MSDWTIRIPGSEPQPLTDEQLTLLAQVEAELPALRGDADGVSALEARVAPIVRALLRSGLTADQVADNTRLRPAFVKRIGDADA